MMLQRPEGATLSEIMSTMGWQKHTVRGLVSILGSKGGEKIESSKNAAGRAALTRSRVNRLLPRSSKRLPGNGGFCLPV